MSTFWAVFIETRRVVVFHEKMAKTGLVREETTVGACDEGARGLLSAEETRRKSVDGTELACVVVKKCTLDFCWHGHGMNPLQKSLGGHRCLFAMRTEQTANRKEEKDVLAGRHLVGTVASDGRCRNSDDACVARGSEHKKNAVDRSFGHVEGLSG